MRARIDAQVASVLLAEAPSVIEEVLAASEPLRARRAQGRHACEWEVESHIRALAASVDLRAPSVFRAHAHWVAQVHESSGLPAGVVVACLQALSKRIHYGKFVAESKFRAAPDAFRSLARAQDAAGLMRRITDEDVEIAWRERRDRAGAAERSIRDLTIRGEVHLDTDGQRVGVVNATRSGTPKRIERLDVRGDELEVLDPISRQGS